MDTIEQLLSRTSVRRFADRPVDRETLETIVLCAQHAPTSEYIQAYTVLNVTDQALRQQIFDRVTAQKPILAAPAFLLFCADVNRLVRAAETGGATVPDSYLGSTETFLMASMDTAIAAQNAVTAAEALGLGTTYIGGIRNNLSEMIRLFALPRGVYPLFGMVLGYPAEGPEQRRSSAKPRLPLSLVLHENQYNAGDASALSAYDEAVRAYYRKRTAGQRNESWSEQMAGFAAKPQRPDLKAALAAQGFSLE